MKSVYSSDPELITPYCSLQFVVHYTPKIHVTEKLPIFLSCTQEMVTKLDPVNPVIILEKSTVSLVRNVGEHKR